MKINEGTEKQYYMDGYLYENLVTAKEKVQDDWDFLFVIDGLERGGKILRQKSL